MSRLLVTCLLCAAIALRSNSEARAQEPSAEALEAYAAAKLLVVEGKVDEALDRFEAALDASYPTPSDVLADRAFVEFRIDPDRRARLSAMLRTNIRESEVRIVTVGELGEWFRVFGTIVDSETGEGIPEAFVYLYQTDAMGLYGPEHPHSGAGADNPRLFAYVKTDDEGRFVLETIRPASYPNSRIPRHIHYTVQAKGYRTTTAEFFVHGAPDLTDGDRALAKRNGWPIVEPVFGDDQWFRGDVTIAVERTGE